MDNDPRFNLMQTVKRRMFAMRNGVIADTLRKAGEPYRIIFGLNLPQIVEIAREVGPDYGLALKLWDNDSTRESRLLAPMIMPHESFTIDLARQWILSIKSAEGADVLCHRLLRHLPYALDIVDEYRDSDSRLVRYTALRLMCNLARNYPDKAAEIGRAELGRTDNPHRGLALQLSQYA